MAEILLSPLLDNVISSLGSALVKEIRVVWGVEEEVDSLCSTLSAIRSSMKDAEEMQVHNNTLRDWLRKLKDVTYDAEDVIDIFSLEALQAKQTGDSKKRKEVRNLFSCFCLKKVAFRHEIGYKIQDITKRLDKIEKERNQFHLSETSVARPIKTRERPYSGPLIDAPTVVGREEEKDELIKELLVANGSVNEKHPIVIPIVAMGGLGKTTLARLVYNSEEAEKHFEVRGWVCVSDRFEMERVTREIIESITREKCEVIQPERHLKNLIQGKRFFIMLDNVWDDALEYWDDFCTPFTYGDKGSKLIVTTRSEKVSRIMGTSTPFHLKGLPYEDCLKLFLRKAFVNDHEERYPNLVDIGKRIVKKCGGVPLAINTLGGLLTFKRSESEWNGVLESSFWKLLQKENSILPALRLSYHNLPPLVKPCFAFCSIFPKDYIFDKDILIRMWMAQGYLQLDRWREEEEDVGDEYFNDLLMISFFSRCPDFENRYIMHDLVHDLAESLAKEECIRWHNGKLDLIPEKNSIPERAHHASLIFENGKIVSFDDIKRFERLRTLVADQSGIELVEFDCVNIVQKFKFLRVLSLKHDKINRLPDVFGSLQLLRYIDLSNTRIEELPDSICNLLFLRSLDLHDCINLKKLPDNTSSLTNLRHLNMENCNSLTCMPTQIGKLTNLREMPWFIAGKEAGKKIVELKGLSSLKGKLVIRGLENVVDGEEAKETGLKNKQLWELGLYWTREEARDGSIDEDVLENLQPHINLKGFSLNGYQGTSLPSWLPNLPCLKILELWCCLELASLPKDLEKLKSLEYLNLWGCSKISSLPRCGLPKSLKQLTIRECPLLNESMSIDGSIDEDVFENLQPHINLECLILEGYQGTSLPSWLPNLPSLKQLVLCYCSELASLPEDLEKLGSLESLSLISCPKISSLPRCGMPKSLKELDIINCFLLMESCNTNNGRDWPKIAHIPDIDIF